MKTRSVAGRVLPAAMTIHPLLTLRCLQMSLWRRPQAMAVPYEGYRWVEGQEGELKSGAVVLVGVNHACIKTVVSVCMSVYGTGVQDTTLRLSMHSSSLIL